MDDSKHGDVLRLMPVVVTKIGGGMDSIEPGHGRWNLAMHVGTTAHEAPGGRSSRRDRSGSLARSPA